MSTQVQIFRKSGQPIDPNAQLNYQNEWAEMYDKVEAKVDKIHSKRTHQLFLLPKHVLQQRFLNYVERQLTKKHNVDVWETLPTTADEWNQLSLKYGGCPLMVAQRSDKNETILIIMDEF